jgi:hypothetical protein
VLAKLKERAAEIKAKREAAAEERRLKLAAKAAEKKAALEEAKLQKGKADKAVVAQQEESLLG